MSNLQNQMGTAPPLVQLAIAAGPSPDYARPADWNRVRPVIKRLYVDEDKRLRDVMDIMANDYGHRGTVKMYKSRIEKWGLDKNIKEDEALAIVRKKSERNSVGKKSVFRVRGKSMAIADVMRYFRRKGILNPETMSGLARPPTPSAIECLTPAPSPSPHDTWDPVDEEIQRDTNCSGPYNMYVDSIPSTMAPSFTQALQPNQAYLSLDHIHQFLFSDPEIPRSPLPPQSLVESEKLFAAIRAYYAGALDSGMFVTNDEGFLVNRDFDYSVLAHLEFYDYCLTLSDRFLRNKKSFTEGRRCLSRALSLVERILREQQPSALEYFLDALQLLGEYPEIVMMLRNHFSDMAAILFTEGHPWRQIFTQFCLIDNFQLEQTIYQSKRCNYDVFNQFIGPFHRHSLESYSSFIVFQHTPSDATIALARLLKQAEQELGETDLTTINVKFAYGQSLYQADRSEEAVVVLEELNAACRMHGLGMMTVISHELIASCHYYMDHARKAELIIKKAIEINEGVFGKDDTLNLVFKSTLEEWLREWGRETEADELRAEVMGLIGLDKIDMEGMTI